MVRPWEYVGVIVLTIMIHSQQVRQHHGNAKPTTYVPRQFILHFLDQVLQATRRRRPNRHKGERDFLIGSLHLLFNSTTLRVERLKRGHALRSPPGWLPCTETAMCVICATVRASKCWWLQPDVSSEVSKSLRRRAFWEGMSRDGAVCLPDNSSDSSKSLDTSLFNVQRST